MFSFKPKKVFAQLNKMDRKQAYTIGAIAVVSIVALIMLITVATSNQDDSFDGMNPQGYDLATLPFVTDQAEQILLASKYPDMRENGSTLLYSAQEKQDRQEEDAQALEEEMAKQEENASDYEAPSAEGEPSVGDDYARTGSGGGKRAQSKTEIGQLSSAGMASAGGSGVNSTWGPSGDFRPFKNREDKGREVAAQLQTGNARKGLTQFKQGTYAAATFKDNRLTGQKQAVMGAGVAGTGAINKDGTVDLSKAGGLTIDPDAPASSSDLSNLDKQLADAAKKAEGKKDPPKPEEPWWKTMLIDLAKSVAKKSVDAVMGALGDTVRGNISARNASRHARNDVYRAESDKYYASLTQDDVRVMTGDDTMTVEKFQEKYSPKKFYKKWGSKEAQRDSAVVDRANTAGIDAAAAARKQADEVNAARARERAEQQKLALEIELEKIQQNTEQMKRDREKKENDEKNK